MECCLVDWRILFQPTGRHEVMTRVSSQVVSRLCSSLVFVILAPSLPQYCRIHRRLLVAIKDWHWELAISLTKKPVCGSRNVIKKAQRQKTVSTE